MDRKTHTADELLHLLERQAAAQAASEAPGGAPSLPDDPEFVFESLRTDIAESISRAMRDAGLNENQLAKKLGMSRQAVNEALAMKGNMTLRTLAKFTVALGCAVSVRVSPRPAKACAAQGWSPAPAAWSRLAHGARGPVARIIPVKNLRIAA